MRYKSNSKKTLYKVLLNQFDYVNTMILNEILETYRNFN